MGYPKSKSSKPDLKKILMGKSAKPKPATPSKAEKGVSDFYAKRGMPC